MQEDSRAKQMFAQEVQSEEDAGPAGKEFGTCWISVVSGGLAALGAALVLDAVLGAGAVGGSGRSETARLLVTVAAAFLVGGYVAGRMAGRLGLKHGLLVALVSLAATAALEAAVVVVGLDSGDSTGGVTPAKLPETYQGFGILLSPAGVLALILPFIGGAFGGAWGANVGRERR